MKKYQNEVLVSESRPVLGGFLPLQERDGNNGIVSEYVWGLNMGGGIGGLLDLKQGGQNYGYLYDGKGNVTALLNGGQSVVAAYIYDAFGNLMSETGSLSQPFQFSTKPHDEQTGLSYFGYRFYSPILGRWMTQDPIGYMGGLNLYAYVGNNPVNWVDPYGLDWESALELTADNYFQSASASGTWSTDTVGWLISSPFVPGPYGSPDPSQWGSWGSPGSWTSLPCEAGKFGKGWEYAEWGAIGTATAAEAAAIGLMGAEMAGWNTIIKPQGPHHTFGCLGNLSHIQINWWRVGVRGSGRVIRIPLPW